jgi:hypothetical protein
MYNNTRHNDIQCSDTKHIDNEHNDTYIDIQHNAIHLNYVKYNDNHQKALKCHNSDWHYTKRH